MTSNDRPWPKRSRRATALLAAQMAAVAVLDSGCYFLTSRSLEEDGVIRNASKALNCDERRVTLDNAGAGSFERDGWLLSGCGDHAVCDTFWGDLHCITVRQVAGLLACSPPQVRLEGKDGLWGIGCGGKFHCSKRKGGFGCDVLHWKGGEWVPPEAPLALPTAEELAWRNASASEKREILSQRRAAWAEAAAQSAQRVSPARAPDVPTPEAERELPPEEQLLAAVEANPADPAALGELVEFHARRKAWPEAKAAWRRFLAASDGRGARADFARWLWAHDFRKEALVEARAAQAAEPRRAGLHSLCGQLLADNGLLVEAQPELYLATVEDSEDLAARAALDGVTKLLGPMPAAMREQFEWDFWKAQRSGSGSSLRDAGQ